MGRFPLIVIALFNFPRFYVFNSVFKLLLFCLYFLLCQSLYCQDKYLGGSTSFTFNSSQLSLGIGENFLSSSSLFIVPELGIVREKNQFYGLNIGFSLARNKDQVTTGSLLAVVLGLNYRRFFGDDAIKPMFGLGLSSRIGQYNVSGNGMDYFGAQIPFQVGVLFRVFPKWSFVCSLDLLGMRYERLGGLSSTEIEFLNGSGVSFSFVRFVFKK